MKQINIDYQTMIDRVRDGKCPVCGQSNVDYPSGKNEWGDPCYQQANCMDCESIWNEHYILNDVSIEETVEQEVNIKDEELGWIRNIPEILKALLNNKKMLPAFIGLDTQLDKLIEEKLREK